ncbi:MAG: rRNA maturation RNase YbeY [Bacteroidales bacterium]|nr:rRNA maturation RNase YbeY [Bacteroidales bacterium]
MGIRFHSIYPSNIHFSKSRFNFTLNQLLRYEKKTLGEISVIFCDNRYILQINIDYLKHYYPTDVITFDYSFNSVISGDIFIGVDVVKQNAKKYHTTFQNELIRVILHGILHLCGYKDKTNIQKQLMRKKENFYLKIYTGYAR